MMKMKYEHMRLLVILSVLLIIFFLAKQQTDLGRATGTEFTSLDDARAACSPGKSIWSKEVQVTCITTPCDPVHKYVLATSQPPTYNTLVEACEDGIICCKRGMNDETPTYNKELASNCAKVEAVEGAYAYKVSDDFCEPHECENDGACVKKFDAPNDCMNPFWEPHLEDVQGTCVNYKCSYVAPKQEVCEDWQLFIQEYNWYLLAGLAFVLIMALIISSRPRPYSSRRTRRR